MKDLPRNVEPYKRTPEFTEQTAPNALRKGHCTKPGTWGQIVVLEGSLTYRILEPTIEELTLERGLLGVIEPTVMHEVDLHGLVKFYVQFFRVKCDDQ